MWNGTGWPGDEVLGLRLYLGQENLVSKLVFNAQSISAVISGR